jgi:aryl-alcohol dehydrogenase-like predicted oxidoreductase
MRPIGRTGLVVPPLGFGAFKIGRNQAVKYAQPYDLPDPSAVSYLLNSILDLGCTLIDTAPAYGLSEARIGEAIGHRRSEFVLSTKVGETFIDGKSSYDFSESAIKKSLERSFRNLRSDILDIVFIHSDGNDRQILETTPIVSVLKDFRSRGLIRAIGLSGKTTEGSELAMDWADVLMVEYHLENQSAADTIAKAVELGIAVFVKKGLASGKLNAGESIRFALSNSGVTSLIVGGLNFDHFRDNWQVALQMRTG